MSADWWLEPPGEDPETRDSYWHGNVTYNLTPMLREAGWTWPDGRVWSKEYIEGARAADLGEKVMHVLVELESEPERFLLLNPPNGWGTYEGLLKTWREFVEAIRRWPHAEVRTWF